MKNIDATTLMNMFVSGTDLIAADFEYINELNVFPVPDGDTGTNLKITTKSAIEATMQKLSPNFTLFEFGSVYCRQLLMNARGNSGVIFSQIIRGFFESINESTKTIDSALFIKCIHTAKEKAYKSVSNPVEGTILTIVRLCDEHFVNKKFDDIQKFLKELIQVSLAALKQTPDMLPSLKEANVVDSGGYGLCKFFEGIYLATTDKSPNKKKEIVDSEEKALNIKGTSKVNFIQNASRLEISEEGFGYCCEFILQANFITTEDQKPKLKWNKTKFENELLEFGDSIILIVDEDIIKLHMHAVEPYKFLQAGQKYGEFLKIKIENMTQQYLDSHPEVNPKTLFKKNKLKNECAIVATVPSAEIAELYKSEFGILATINTAKSGNPSTNEIITQIKSVHSKNVIVVTDDSNIILSAEQAAELVKDKYNVSIVRGKNIIESFFACMDFSESKDLLANTKSMTKIVKKTFSALVSTSIKSAKFKNVIVEKGNHIGIINKEIVVADVNILPVVYFLINKLINGSFLKKISMVYVIYGKNTLVKDLRALEKYVNENFGIKCKLINGNQEIYNFYIGVQ